MRTFYRVLRTTLDPLDGYIVSDSEVLILRDHVLYAPQPRRYLAAEVQVPPTLT